jgi:hypothetical protein
VSAVTDYIRFVEKKSQWLIQFRRSIIVEPLMQGAER